MSDEIERTDSQVLLDEVIKRIREGKVSDANALKKLVDTLLALGVIE